MNSGAERDFVARAALFSRRTAVDWLHSIENTDRYKRSFFLDSNFIAGKTVLVL
jgi:hypothetical protein